MSDNVGTYSIDNLFESRFAAQSAAEFGFDNINEIFAQQLAFWNEEVTMSLSDLAMSTIERQGIAGSSTSVRGVKLDEFGRGKGKLDKPGATVAFPLDRFGYPLGKTSMWLLNAKVPDLGQFFQSVQTAHLRDLRQELKIAMFTSVNKAFVDLNVDNVSLTVKRFLNADGDQIPDSPQDGSSFNPDTHDHYLANATLDVAALNGLIDTVIEHSVNGDLVVNINRADIAAFQGLTGFVNAQSTRIEVFRDTTRDDVPFVRDDRGKTSNKFVGVFGVADVWVKPWGIANYAMCYDRNAPKPLGYRRHSGQIGLTQKQLVSIDPIAVNFFEALFGFGVMTRTNGAVLQFDNASYVDPTILG